MADLKHGEVIKRIITTMHEPWMNDEDKAKLEAIILDRTGKDLDEALEDGIKEGISIEAQEQLLTAIMMKLNLMRTLP